MLAEEDGGFPSEGVAVENRPREESHGLLWILVGNPFGEDPGTSSMPTIVQQRQRVERRVRPVHANLADASLGAVEKEGRGA